MTEKNVKQTDEELLLDGGLEVFNEKFRFTPCRLMTLLARYSMRSSDTGKELQQLC